MADNTEYLPQIGKIDDTKTKRDYKLIGDGNVVSPSAKDVVVNGVNNFVGEECQRVNIMASSGCTVTSGVTDISITNSSGITVNESGLTYIKGVLITEDSFVTGDPVIPSSGVTFSQSLVFTSDGTYEMTTADYTVVNSPLLSEITLPIASGQTQIFRVKNDSDQENPIQPDGSDTIEGEDELILSIGDAVTLQSDGSTNYYIL